jgi:hypothetical protein
MNLDSESSTQTISASKGWLRREWKENKDCVINTFQPEDVSSWREEELESVGLSVNSSDVSVDRCFSAFAKILMLGSSRGSEPSHHRVANGRMLLAKSRRWVWAMNSNGNSCCDSAPDSTNSFLGGSIVHISDTPRYTWVCQPNTERSFADEVKDSTYSLTASIPHDNRLPLQICSALRFEKYQGLGNDFILVDNRGKVGLSWL